MNKRYIGLSLYVLFGVLLVAPVWSADYKLGDRLPAAKAKVAAGIRWRC